jgi:hypothetical protein
MRRKTWKALWPNGSFQVRDGPFFSSFLLIISFTASTACFEISCTSVPQTTSMRADANGPPRHLVLHQITCCHQCLFPKTSRACRASARRPRSNHPVVHLQIHSPRLVPVQSHRGHFLVRPDCPHVECSLLLGTRGDLWISTPRRSQQWGSFPGKNHLQLLTSSASAPASAWRPRCWEWRDCFGMDMVACGDVFRPCLLAINGKAIPCFSLRLDN